MYADGLPDEKLFERHVDLAAVLYKQGHEFLFENVYGLFLSASKNFCQNYIDAAIRFFRETSTLTLALEKLACSEDDNDWFALDQLITKEEPLFGRFCELYEQDKLITPEWFEKFAWQNRYDAAIFGQCRELVYKKTGRMMDTPDPRTNFSQKRVEDKQYFFDALFEKSKMSDIISALVSVYGNPKLKVCDLRQFRLQDFNHPLGARELASALIHSDLAEELVSDFLEVIDWDSFVLNRMTH